jgi:hypothetical protein
MAQVQALKPDLVPYLTSVLCGPGEQKGTIRTSSVHTLSCLEAKGSMLLDERKIKAE